MPETNLVTPIASFVRVSPEANEELFNYIAFTNAEVYAELPDGSLVLKRFKGSNQFHRKAEGYTLYALTHLDERITKLAKDDIRTHTPALIRETSGALRCDLITDFTGGVLIGRFGAYSLAQVEQLFNYETQTKNHIDLLHRDKQQEVSAYPPAELITPAPPAVPSGAEFFRDKAANKDPVLIARMDRLSDASTTNGGMSFVTNCETCRYALQSIDDIQGVRLGAKYLVKISPRGILEDGGIDLYRCFIDAGCYYESVMSLKIEVVAFYRYAMGQMKIVACSQHEENNTYKLGGKLTKDLTDNDLFYAHVTFAR